MKKVKTLRSDNTMPVIVIPVGSKTIETAIKADSHKCMIADAIKLRIPGAQYISVDLQSIRFTDSKNHVRYKYFTPLVGQQRLVEFDQGKKVKPFALTLKDGIQEDVKAESQKRRLRKGSTSKSKRPISRTKPYKSRAKKERRFGLRNLE